MSTHVVGFRPPDDKWAKMKAVWDSCATAGVSAPEEVRAFFEDRPPDDVGVEVDVNHLLRTWKKGYSEGFEIDVSKLPKDVKIIRFFNAW